MVKIATNNYDIERIINLRYEILRKPWDKAKETATDDLEPTAINAYIEENEMVIACARLQDNGNGIGQIRFMAVKENMQGRGLGKKLISELELKAKEINLKRIQFQARESAVKFYISCGYKIKEKSFLMWDVIQHYQMEKILDK